MRNETVNLDNDQERLLDSRVGKTVQEVVDERLELERRKEVDDWWARLSPAERVSVYETINTR